MAFPTFASGDVLLASDMNAVGLWLVKTQTVGTGVSSVTVTGAFSSTYDNYRITWTGGTLSTGTLVSVYMGASPAANGYSGGRASVTVAGVANGNGDNNNTNWSYAGVGGTNSCNMAFDLFNPNLTTRTWIFSQYFEFLTATAFGTYVGILDNTTSYTSFTLDPSGAATMTGGTIRVYGYRN